VKAPLRSEGSSSGFAVKKVAFGKFYSEYCGLP